MDFRIFIEPQQGASYADQLRVAQAAEAAGYDAFFRSDHYLVMGDRTGLPGPTDTWMTLAAIGTATQRIKLGTLVTSATFRFPGPLAVAVAQADEMSGGRVEFGLGAGWFEAEHTAYAIPFPPLGERFERLEEQLEIITGLWDTPVGERYSFSGTHYAVVDSPALPKPTRRPPVVVGGKGTKRTPRLAARFAAEINVPFSSVEDCLAVFDGVDRACAAIDRDPATIVRSVAHTAAVGRDDAELEKRRAATGQPAEALAANPLVGTPAQVVDALGRWRERTGISRVYLQQLDLDDIDALELIAAEVAPHLA